MLVDNRPQAPISSWALIQRILHRVDIVVYQRLNCKLVCVYALGSIGSGDRWLAAHHRPEWFRHLVIIFIHEHVFNSSGAACAAVTYGRPSRLTLVEEEMDWISWTFFLGMGRGLQYLSFPHVSALPSCCHAFTESDLLNDRPRSRERLDFFTLGLVSEYQLIWVLEDWLLCECAIRGFGHAL